MAFYTGERQVEGGNNLDVDTVEVRFRGSKRDQVLSGELMQELYRIHGGRSDLSLMAYRSHGGWEVDERPSYVLPAPGVVSGCDGTGEQEGRREGAAGPGRVRITLREDRGRNEVSGYGSEPAGDTAGRKVVIQCVTGV